MKKLIAGIFVCAALFGCSQNSKKEGTPMATPVAKEKAVAGDNSTSAPMSTQTLKAAKADELLPEVASAYKGIVISVTDIKKGSSMEMEVPFGQEIKIKDTPLSVTVQSFFPDFTMVNGGVANKSMNENNPGAKVVIKKDGNMMFDGWLFQKFPGTHGLEDADYNMIMVKSVPVK